MRAADTSPLEGYETARTNIESRAFDVIAPCLSWQSSRVDCPQSVGVIDQFEKIGMLRWNGVIDKKSGDDLS